MEPVGASASHVTGLVSAASTGVASTVVGSTVATGCGPIPGGLAAAIASNEIEEHVVEAETFVQGLGVFEDADDHQGDAAAANAAMGGGGGGLGAAAAETDEGSEGEGTQDRCVRPRGGGRGSSCGEVPPPSKKRRNACGEDADADDDDEAPVLEPNAEAASGEAVPVEVTAVVSGVVNADDIDDVPVEVSAVAAVASLTDVTASVEVHATAQPLRDTSKSKRERSSGARVPSEQPPSPGKASSMAAAAVARAQAELAAQGILTKDGHLNTEANTEAQHSGGGSRAARGGGRGKGRAGGKPTPRSNEIDINASAMTVPGMLGRLTASVPAEYSLAAAESAADAETSGAGGSSAPLAVTAPEDTTEVIPATQAKPFLAMLPLTDQTSAKNGHVLMMPVQISYDTMCELLQLPPLTNGELTKGLATELSNTMLALVTTGKLRILHTDDDGPKVSFMPGCKPPMRGTLPSMSEARDDEDQVRGCTHAERMLHALFTRAALHTAWCTAALP